MNEDGTHLYTLERGHKRWEKKFGERETEEHGRPAKLIFRICWFNRISQLETSLETYFVLLHSNKIDICLPGVFSTPTGLVQECIEAISSIRFTTVQGEVMLKRLTSAMTKLIAMEDSHLALTLSRPRTFWRHLWTVYTVFRVFCRVLSLQKDFEHIQDVLQCCNRTVHDWSEDDYCWIKDEIRFGIVRKGFVVRSQILERNWTSRLAEEIVNIGVLSQDDAHVKQIFIARFRDQVITSMLNPLAVSLRRKNRLFERFELKDIEILQFGTIPRTEQRLSVYSPPSPYYRETLFVENKKTRDIVIDQCLLRRDFLRMVTGFMSGSAR